MTKDKTILRLTLELTEIDLSRKILEEDGCPVDDLIAEEN